MHSKDFSIELVFTTFFSKKFHINLQRWAKLTTLRVLTIFLEALFQIEKRLRGWIGA
jgi:hypothetical protein